jgi:hypothetical protein
MSPVLRHQNRRSFRQDAACRNNNGISSPRTFYNVRRSDSQQPGGADRPPSSKRKQIPELPAGGGRILAVSSGATWFFSPFIRRSNSPFFSIIIVETAIKIQQKISSLLIQTYETHKYALSFIITKKQTFHNIFITLCKKHKNL